MRLFSCFYTARDNDLDTVIKNDNITEFSINYKNNETSFRKSLEYNSTKIMNYCINNSIGVNGFHYVVDNRPDEIDSYIEKNFSKIFEKKLWLFALEHRYYFVKYKLINHINFYKSENIIHDVQEYDEDEFEFHEIIQQGSYGILVNAYHKRLGNIVIKKYVMNENLIKTYIDEFSLMYRLRKCNYVCPVYGYYISDDCIVNIVMKKMMCSLYDIFPLLQGEELCYSLTTKLLEAVNEINSNGVIHNDLKLNNIMIDYDFSIKVIDFGLSYFYGLCPSLDDCSYSLMTPHIKPPDLNPSHIFYDHDIHTFKSYNSDVYSICVEMMNILMGTKNKCYIFKDNLYQINNGKLVEIMVSDSPLVNILKNGLHYDCRLRYNAKRILYNTHEESQLFKAFIRIDYKFQKYRKIDRELLYREEIFRNCDVLITTRINYIDLNLYEDILNSLKFINYEVKLNILLKLLLFTTVITNKEKINNILSVLIEHHTNNCPDCHLYYEKTQKRESTKRYIYSSIELYKYYPFLTYVSYIAIKLEQLNYNHVEIIEELKEKLLKFIIINRTLNNIRLSDLVISIYNTIPDVPFKLNCENNYEHEINHII